MKDLQPPQPPVQAAENKVEEVQKKRVEFKKNLEEEKKADDRKRDERKTVELKPILIKVDEPQIFDCNPSAHTAQTKPDIAGIGVLMMSKRKNKNWLHVPVKQKQKTPLFPDQKEEEEEEVEEISENPYTIKGAKVNLLGTPDFFKKYLSLLIYA